jgi:hypothetical protein
MEGGLITPPALIGTGPLMGVTAQAESVGWQTCALVVRCLAQGIVQINSLFQMSEKTKCFQRLSNSIRSILIPLNTQRIAVQAIRSVRIL